MIAVGHSRLSTLAMRVSGSSWQQVVAANANLAPNTNRSIGNALLGVDTSAGGATWVAGYYYNGSGSGTTYGVQRTLVERYTCA